VSARLRTGWKHAALSVVFVAAAVWCVHHAVSVSGFVTGKGSSYSVIYAVMFMVLVWQISLAYMERPVTVTRRQQRLVNEMNVAGIVPAYNEDPAMLEACVISMLNQVRKPQTIVVVDDGSTTSYSGIEHRVKAASEDAGVTLLWIRQDNKGKRHAQVAGVLAVPDAQVIWTVDSDSVSDTHALDELMKGFADPQVMSVAGVVLAANVHRSFLTRFTDLLFVTGQLTDRSALSAVKSVWVNSGPIAAYRAHVIRDNTSGYLNETFRGHHVPFSDDSYLTLCAKVAGKTIQQPSAFCFSLMPERIGNHFRQYDRWMRGSFIRSLWRMRYLPTNGVAYWLHLARWMQTVVALVMMLIVIVSLSLHGNNVNVETVAWLIGVPLAVGYATSLRYMLVERTDQSTWYQWCTWMLSPVTTVWQLTFLRAVRWYSISSVLLRRSKHTWNTRQSVEVVLTD
jgi:hyaluronan synthase